MVDSGLLDYCIRDDLKAKAKVVMAVLDPLKLVITNYPEDQVEMMELENNPKHQNWANVWHPSPESFISKERTSWKNP